jgi:hypothetical protein
VGESIGEKSSSKHVTYNTGELNMIVRKMLFVSAISLGLLAGQAEASEQGQLATTAEAECGGGTVKSIDLAINQVVISDVVYGYPSGRLIVHKGGKRASGATALQPNQVVHFMCAPRKPGSSLAAGRTITEIWIDEK